MIDTAGAYILVLVLKTIYVGVGAGGVATHEMESFEACKAAQVQLEVIQDIKTYCIAATLKEE